MNSFDPLHPKTSAIIELLAEKKTLSTKQLLKLLKKEKGIEMSTANLYKIIGKMVHEQMLVKTGDDLALNMIWATHVHKYAQMMQGSTHSNMESFRPFEEGERRVFKGESLDKVDPIWTHLVLYLFTQEKDKTVHVYESHPWYLLGRSSIERRLYESCQLQGKKMQILHGNQTFLDQYAQKLNQMDFCTFAITNDPPFPKEGYTFWVCGDYIIECTFPQLISQYFASFFQSTKEMEAFDLNTFSSIFHIKAPVELKVSRDGKKAKEMLKGLKKFF